MLFNLFFSYCIIVFTRFFQMIFLNKKMKCFPRFRHTHKAWLLPKASPQLLITSLLAKKGDLVKSLNSMKWKRFRIAWEMGRVSGKFCVPPWSAQDPAIFAASLSLWFFLYKCFSNKRRPHWKEILVRFSRCFLEMCTPIFSVVANCPRDNKRLLHL